MTEWWNHIFIVPDLNLYNFWFSCKFQLTFVWIKSRIWQNFTILLNISLRNHPFFYLSLVLRIFLFEYFFTIFCGTFIISTLVLFINSFMLNNSTFIYSFIVFFSLSYELRKGGYFCFQCLQFPLLLFQSVLIFL